MKCPHHPTYQGYKKTKRDCPICQKIWKETQGRIGHKYHSITTPKFKCGTMHLLSELSCVMIFGNLPPYFWRKDTPVSSDIKKHYQTTYKQLQQWYNHNNNIFKDFEVIIYNIFVKPNDKQKQNTQKILSDITKIEMPKVTSVEKEQDYFEVSSQGSPINKISAHKKLKQEIKECKGENNGEKDSV